MNAGQEKFKRYICERCTSNHIQDVEELLQRSFKKQDEGSFATTDIEEMIEMMIPWIKPENRIEVEHVMKNFQNKG